MTLRGYIPTGGSGGCELKQVRRGCTASLARGTACGEGRVVSSPAASGGWRLLEIGLGGKEVFNGAVTKELCK